MGFAGGLVPSPSALVVLLGAIALGRTWFGVLLVVAYGGDPHRCRHGAGAGTRRDRPPQRRGRDSGAGAWPSSPGGPGATVAGVAEPLAAAGHCRRAGAGRPVPRSPRGRRDLSRRLSRPAPARSRSWPWRTAGRPRAPAAPPAARGTPGWRSGRA